MRGQNSVMDVGDSRTKLRPNTIRSYHDSSKHDSGSIGGCVDKTETVADALANLGEAFDDFWAALEADEHLDADERAEVTALVDSASTDVADAKKVVRDSAEKD